MTVTTRFNDLNNRDSTRKEIELLLADAIAEEQHLIVSRLKKPLELFPNETNFRLNLTELAFETVPISWLSGLSFENITDDEDSGLNKAVSTSEIYDMMTSKMLDLIEKANKGDYKRAWKEVGI